MSVTIHLPGAPGAVFAAVSAISQKGVLDAAQITVNAVPLGTAGDAFTPAGRSDVVDLYVTDTAAALAANAAGADLVEIASLQHAPRWQLLTLAKGKVKSLAQLAGKSVYVDGLPGDELALTAALQAAKTDPAGVTLIYPDDSSFSFDPTQLVDSTVAAVLVRNFDGYPRLVQFADPNTGVSVGATYYRELPIAAVGSGLNIWASAAAITSDDAQIAAAATLIALSQSEAACRDDVQACATLFDESSLTDLDVNTVAWALDALNASIWPNSAGLFEMDAATLQRDLDAMTAAGASTPGTPESLMSSAILSRAQGHWPSDVDRNGANWAPVKLEVPLY
jgi:hypothetical protein